MGFNQHEYPQVTYEEDFGIAYVHLTPQSAKYEESFSHTVKTELDILLDLNKERQLTGIEFLFGIGRELRKFAGKNSIFTAQHEEDGSVVYSFYPASLDQGKVRERDGNRTDQKEKNTEVKMSNMEKAQTKTITQELPHQRVDFIFTDDEHEEFFGLRIYDVSAYYKKAYLTGSEGEDT